VAEGQVSRRAVLIAGAAGAAVVAVGGSFALWNLTSDGPAAPPDDATTPGADAAPGPDGETFREPEVLTSVDGRLDLELAAAVATATVAGTEVRVLAYNGAMPGPTLRIRPGDRVTLRLRNDLGATTNLHTHGLVVSPEGNSDNVFTMIEPGASFDYDYRLGDDHPPGVFWYHPHHHGTTAEQLFGGLYGAIIVEDAAAAVPVARERLLVVADIRFDGDGAVAQATRFDRMLGREGDLVLVNGQLLPTMSARPGDRERWRIVNACTSRYLRLRLDGQRMSLLGVDGSRYAEPRELDEFVLLPGNRADVVVTMAEGESVLQTLPFDRGSMGMMGSPPSATTGADLARLSVSGAAGEPGAALPSSAPRDLRAEEVTRRRTVTLAMGGMGMGGGMAFTIDGRAFDHDRTDIEVASGAIEEWTIVNTSTMDHPFHLHVWPMQLVEIDGAPVDRVDARDVVPVPAGGRVVVRIAFEGIAGRTVYHCHILDHEDLGMMGVIRVG
jgi:FtsP/CotA-like multicopper oxidase with cupredoxin domain